MVLASQIWDAPCLGNFPARLASFFGWFGYADADLLVGGFHEA